MANNTPLINGLLASLLVAAGALLSSTAQAATQPIASIRSVAEAFVRAQLPQGAEKHHVSAAQLDSRLRLHACAAPLEAFVQNAAPGGARQTVGVRCTADNPWTIYVPVTVEVEIPVLALRRALGRGARIEPTDVEPQVRRLPGAAANFISDASHLHNHRLKRALPAGAALTVDVLTPDILVRRGQRVTLIAALGGVEIRAQGEALTDGAAHQRVRVQNVSSLKVVEGVVQDDGAVRVDL
ncbi:MAG TPA: flagellar basal body P-ring formation chaperone FlgA [Steroidobacter sp.]|nr:flagellar basal body P-ring formation chaperone FlgA [Steroidobacteraceae bacterium]HLS82548.1 flagellar basal body P-ring formation chaperone FlgA [Steroidobacter sp.]